MSPPGAGVRVFVSSTYQDLVAFRAAAAQALRQLGYDVYGMEDSVATDERPVDLSLAEVRTCALYVGIFAWRYGAVPAGHERSITELEYREAGERGLDRLIFLVDDDAPWPRDQVERGPGQQQIDRLRTELRAAHTVRTFSTPDELAAQVATSAARWAAGRLSAAVDTLRQERGRSAAGPQEPPARVVNLPPVEAREFVDRAPEREEVLGFLAEESVRMVKVLGRAGMGKTALVSRVTADLEPGLGADAPADGRPGLAAVLYFSSRSTGLSLERLYADVRRVLPTDAADQLATAWASRDSTLEQQVDTLLSPLRQRRYLVVLDAVDPAVGEDGSVVDEGLGAFMDACLRRSWAPVLVVTSRVDFPVPAETLPGIRTVKLRDGLSPLDAVALLRALDPQGDLGLEDAPAEDVSRAVELTGGIPRALEVLAGVLQRDPAASLRTVLAAETDGQQGPVEALVAESYRHLTPSEHRVLEALAVLERPVGPTAIAFLLHPWFPGVDVAPCLRRLSDSYFVTASRRSGTFTLLRLDREHVYRGLLAGEAGAARAAGAATPRYDCRALELRAAEFYAGLRAPVDQWRTIDDLAPQLAEIQHLLRAGDAGRAFAVLATIDRDHLFQWGNYTRLIELREQLVGRLPGALDEAENLARLAICEQVIGRYDAAVGSYGRAVTLARGAGDERRAVEYGGHLGRTYRNLGDMDEAVIHLRAALEAARQDGDRRATAVWSDRLALALWHRGELAEAERLGASAAETAAQLGDAVTQAAALSNLGLVHRTRGEDASAERCFEDGLRIAREVADRRQEAIILGRLGALALAAGDPARAGEVHRAALDIAEELGERREQSHQLLGLGRAMLAQGQLEAAADRLRLARDLQIPETGYLAAVQLAVVALRRHEAQVEQRFADAVDACRGRLARCDRLFQARYALGTALVGAAVAGPHPPPDPPEAHLAGAVAELRRATADCPGQGVVRDTLADLWQVGAAVPGGVPVEVLAPLLDHAGRPPAAPPAAGR